MALTAKGREGGGPPGCRNGPGGQPQPMSYMEDGAVAQPTWAGAMRGQRTHITLPPRSGVSDAPGGTAFWSTDVLDAATSGRCGEAPPIRHGGADERGARELVKSMGGGADPLP